MAAMPSRTIRPTQAPEPAPFTYTVGTADGLAPQAVFASWDGTGAGGDFLPCVSFYSAEGVLLDRAFPTTGAVTAGDTAEVSYRPFDRSGGGTTPPPPVVTSVFGRAHVTGGLPVVPGNNAQMPLTFDVLQGVGSNVNEFVIQADGWYLLHGQGGFLRTGPGGARDTLQMTMFRPTQTTHGQTRDTIEVALLAGQFISETHACAFPVFCSVGQTIQVFAAVGDNAGATSALGSLKFAAFVGVYQMA